MNGDLVAGQNGHVTISGTPKIKQDLSLALGEHWGTDRFHSDRWGSVVIDYIGLPIDDDLRFNVEQEVSRVLQQYIAIQAAEIYEDYVAGRRSRFATADVIRAVQSVQVQVRYTSIIIRLVLVNQANEAVYLQRSVAQ